VNLQMDISIVVEAFAVVVIGGMGSITGAFLAALLVGEISAFGVLLFPKLTLVLTFLVMAVVLVVRPYGLLGKPVATSLGPVRDARTPLHGAGPRLRLAGVGLLAALALVPAFASEYAQLLVTEILILALFAASLHFIVSIGGLVSFGHAAWFGAGAYTCALLATKLGVPMAGGLLSAPLAAGALALLVGWFCTRLTGVYMAMLTLAFAQILWSGAFQSSWTGGDNGILGVWPSTWLASPARYYYLTLLLCAASVLVLRRAAFAPFGYALRAARDSPLRAEATGIDVRRRQWLAFGLAGAFAGLAGALHAFHKGSVFPNVLSIPQSIDGLVMVLLGGLDAMSGPLAGAAVYHFLQTEIMRSMQYWRAILGGVILLLVLVFPQGIVGSLRGMLQGEK